MRIFDILTVLGYIGIGCAFATGFFLAIEELAPEKLRLIWDPAGFVMAFGGSSMGLLTQFTMDDLRSCLRVIRKAFVVEVMALEKIISDMVRYATIARKEGIMAIERETATVSDPFLRRALQLAVDGTSPDVIEQMLTTEVQCVEDRHFTGRSIVETMATFCPAFGMMGTIMALVLVLSSLDDPKSIGPKMAVALLTTFYGVTGCYAIFTPLAKKLEKRSKEEMLAKRLIIRGIMSIQAGDGPRMVESKLQVFLRQQKTP
jgi:chemotaxis protein MotA